MTEFLTVEQLIEIHDEMLRRHGGLEGIRDVNLLRSSVLLPQTAAFGQDFVRLFMTKPPHISFTS